jgi:hypothetical protein
MDNMSRENQLIDEEKAAVELLGIKKVLELKNKESRGYTHKIYAGIDFGTNNPVHVISAIAYDVDGESLGVQDDHYTKQDCPHCNPSLLK